MDNQRGNQNICGGASATRVGCEALASFATKLTPAFTGMTFLHGLLERVPERRLTIGESFRSRWIVSHEKELATLYRALGDA
jgi:hypothetical protein